jgi:HEAT repeat protein
MMKPEEIESLRLEFMHSDAARKMAAAETLLKTPDAARAFVPELLAGVAATDESLRETCVGALEGMGSPDKSSAKSIVPFLAGDELQGFWAATLLGRIGHEAAFAASQLAASLNSSSSMPVRERCVWALGQIGPAAIESLPVLVAAATSPSPRLARFAKEAIVKVSAT